MAKALKGNEFLDKDILYEIAKDVDKYAALKDVCNAPGGEILLDALISEAVEVTEEISANYSTFNLTDFQARAARLKVVLGLVRSLQNASDNFEGATEALNDALRS